MSPELEQLARYAQVEPPAQLDAWVRAKLRAAVAEHAQGHPNCAATSMPAAPLALSMQSRLPSSPSPAALPARPARAPASVPLVERLALTVGAVACGAQASAFVLRVVWGALTNLGH